MYDVEVQDTKLVNVLKQSVFFGIHLMCLGVIWVGFSWTAFTVAVLLYFIRMFAITGGYHRYFSHRSYKTSRVFQFILGVIGSSSAQKGPLWWASHHRHHHQYSDKPEDIHSAHMNGIWWSHVGWVLSTRFLEARLELIKDFLKYPEIIFLEKYNLVPPIALAVGLYFFGALCGHYAPGLHTTGMQMLIWGFFVSTTFLYHGTFLVNSFTHLVGKRRFKTDDESRNSLVIALVTMGEGWHNNHHRYPGSERQGFYWWEIDMSHYILKTLSWLGIVWDLRVPPERIYAEAKENSLSKEEYSKAA